MLKGKRKPLIDSSYSIAHKAQAQFTTVVDSYAFQTAIRSKFISSQTKHNGRHNGLAHMETCQHASKAAILLPP